MQQQQIMQQQHNIHFKAVNEKIRDKKCPHCDYVAAQSGTIFSHVKAFHEKIRDKKAPHCNYVLQNKVKNNKCPQCLYSLVLYRSVKTH
jgi:hypothetical protein